MQLQYAVQYMLADEEGPERLVAVIDGRGISAHTEHRSRYVRQVKALVSALTEVGSTPVDPLKASPGSPDCQFYVWMNQI